MPVIDVWRVGSPDVYRFVQGQRITLPGAAVARHAYAGTMTITRVDYAAGEIEIG